MQHIGTQTITTPRLILRRFTHADAAPMFQNWAADPAVTKYMSWEPHEDLSVSEGIIATWVHEYQEPNRYEWAIEWEGQPVGSIGLIGPDDEKQEAEAGYCLSRALWGKGIMGEAYAAVLTYAFEKVGFRRIHAKHHVDNPGSGRVMQKCGMRYLETRECAMTMNPAVVMPCHCYAITKEEWEAIQPPTT